MRLRSRWVQILLFLLPPLGTVSLLAQEQLMTPGSSLSLQEAAEGVGRGEDEILFAPGVHLGDPVKVGIRPDFLEDHPKPVSY